MITKRVVLRESEMYFHGNDVINYGAIHKAMREAGIPTIGCLSFLGVSSGRLSMWPEEDDRGKYHVYEWTGSPQIVDNRRIDQDEDQDL